MFIVFPIYHIVAKVSRILAILKLSMQTLMGTLKAIETKNYHIPSTGRAVIDFDSPGPLQIFRKKLLYARL